jgi:hypothetical protein
VNLQCLSDCIKIVPGNGTAAAQFAGYLLHRGTARLFTQHSFDDILAAAAAAAALLAPCRYISEDFGGVALHPVDIIDAASGRLLQQLTDLNLNTITPVNLPHPRLDLIISGSSRLVLAMLAPPSDAGAMCFLWMCSTCNGCMAWCASCTQLSTVSRCQQQPATHMLLRIAVPFAWMLVYSSTTLRKVARLAIS